MGPSLLVPAVDRPYTKGMRRGYAVIAGWLLLGAPALAATVAAVRAAPVQLSFAFAAPSALAPPPVLTAAVPSAAPVAIAPSAAAPVAAAISAAPAAAAAPAAFVAAPEAPKTARKTKIDYDEFGRQLASRQGLSLDPFRHADAKRRILRAAGYDVLHGAGGKRIPLDEAADVRVGSAFLNVKRAFDRR